MRYAAGICWGIVLSMLATLIWGHFEQSWAPGIILAVIGSLMVTAFTEIGRIE